MANKLAGQRAKFSRARAIYYSSSDAYARNRAARHMAEVLQDAPAIGFTETDVTQEEDVPEEVRSLETNLSVSGTPTTDNPDDLVAALRITVDLSDLEEIGEGTTWVYAYGYRCAPDRLKIGSCNGDPISRVAAQIGTGTPDRPALYLTIQTQDCRALERVLHGMLRLKGRQIEGAGAEWFIATREEIIGLYRKIVS